MRIPTKNTYRESLLITKTFVLLGITVTMESKLNTESVLYLFSSERTVGTFHTKTVIILLDVNELC